MTCCRMCFWNLCFKMENSGQNEWNKSRHTSENCVVEGLHDSSSNDCGSLDANGGTHLKKIQHTELCNRFCKTNAGPILWIFQQSIWFCTVARGSCWRRALIQSHHYTMKSHELISAFLYISLCINQIQLLRNSTYCWFSVCGKGSSIPCQ